MKVRDVAAVGVAALLGLGSVVWTVGAQPSPVDKAKDAVKDAGKKVDEKVKQAEKAAEKAMAKSLYERLGGADAIAAVVDDFVPRLAVNKVILANKVVAEKLAKASVPGLKFKLTAQVCEVTGGPWKYAGKGMKEAHVGMKITEEEWSAGVADLRATLDKFKVPSKEQDELIGIIATTKKDIVGL